MPASRANSRWIGFLLTYRHSVSGVRNVHVWCPTDVGHRGLCLAPPPATPGIYCPVNSTPPPPPWTALSTGVSSATWAKEDLLIIVSTYRGHDLPVFRESGSRCVSRALTVSRQAVLVLSIPSKVVLSVNISTNPIYALFNCPYNGLYSYQVDFLRSENE